MNVSSMNNISTLIGNINSRTALNSTTNFLNSISSQGTTGLFELNTKLMTTIGAIAVATYTLITAMRAETMKAETEKVETEKAETEKDEAKKDEAEQLTETKTNEAKIIAEDKTKDAERTEKEENKEDDEKDNSEEKSSMLTKISYVAAMPFVAIKNGVVFSCRKIAIAASFVSQKTVQGSTFAYKKMGDGCSFVYECLKSTGQYVSSMFSYNTKTDDSVESPKTADEVKHGVIKAEKGAKETSEKGQQQDKTTSLGLSA